MPGAGERLLVIRQGCRLSLARWPPTGYAPALGSIATDGINGCYQTAGYRDRRKFIPSGGEMCLDRLPIGGGFVGLADGFLQGGVHVDGALFVDETRLAGLGNGALEGAQLGDQRRLGRGAAGGDAGGPASFECRGQGEQFRLPAHEMGIGRQGQPRAGR